MWSTNNFCQLDGLQTYYRHRALYGCPTLEINKHLADLNSNLAQKLDEYNDLEFSSSKQNVKDKYSTKRQNIKNLKEELPNNNTWLGLDSKFYNWQEKNCSKDNRSYAQVFWKESSRLGGGGCMMGDVEIVVTHCEEPASPQCNSSDHKSSNTDILERLRSKLQLQQEQRERKMQKHRLEYLKRKREYYKRQRELEMQLRLLEEQRKLREEQQYEELKYEQELERCKEQIRLRSTLCDVLAEALGTNTSMSYLGMALTFVATLGAYSFVR